MFPSNQTINNSFEHSPCQQFGCPCSNSPENAEHVCGRLLLFIDLLPPKEQKVWRYDVYFSWDREKGHDAPFWAFSCARAFRAERTRGASCMRSAHCFIKSCCMMLENLYRRDVYKLTRNKSWALALFSGSTFKAKYKKSLKTGLNACSSLIAGVPLVAIR